MTTRPYSDSLGLIVRLFRPQRREGRSCCCWQLGFADVFDAAFAPRHAFLAIRAPVETGAPPGDPSNERARAGPSGRGMPRRALAWRGGESEASRTGWQPRPSNFVPPACEGNTVVSDTQVPSHPYDLRASPASLARLASFASVRVPRQLATRSHAAVVADAGPCVVAALTELLAVEDVASCS
jgi:hypothetical protein